MLEMLLAGALVWPADCRAYGDLYREAARIRDRGLSLELVLKETSERSIRLAIIHTYERRDMSARDWYWMAVGVCVGLNDPRAQPAAEGSKDGPRIALPDS